MVSDKFKRDFDKEMIKVAKEVHQKIREGQRGRFDRNLAGYVFGRLTVIELYDKDKNNQTRWKCKCECGYEPVVRRNDLVGGKSKSCGCSKQKGG